MNFKNIYSSFAVSFEIFPPKTPEGVISLYSELEQLKRFNPAFISVTYGAGGSSQDKTFDLAVQIRQKLGINPLIHFTCVGSGAPLIKEHLEKARAMGLTDILALRGDPPKGSTNFVPPADGFAHANELVSLLRGIGCFSTAVAGYPEKHPEAASFEADVEHLKMKIEAGADIVLTQFFFNNDDYYRLVDALAVKGINVPVIPGMLPITSVSQIEKFSELTGAVIPSALKEKLINSSNPEDVVKVGIEHCVKQCRNLKANGAKGLHMYSLNKATFVGEVLDAVL
jgi:methylenetetrahydrofolate reductase (NADPH)